MDPPLFNLFHYSPRLTGVLPQWGIEDLDTVFAYEATTREQGLAAAERLAYHQEHSGPIMEKLKAWLEGQVHERLVEPNSSLGKAFQYLLNHWHTLTQFLRVPGAPLDNNTVERALKLMIRQRRNSLFYASTHSAYVASVLTSVIATCAQGRHQRARLSSGVTGAPERGLSQSRRLAALELYRPVGAGLSNPAPVLSHMGSLGMAIPEQNVQLTGGQAPGRGLGARPPVEPAL